MELTAQAGIAPYVTRRVTEILEAEQILRLLPPCASINAVIEAVIPEGAPISEAHATWRAEYFPRVRSLEPLQTQNPDAITPPWIVRVVIECVIESSGGMSSYYGFKGHFVSLLVSIPQGCVWDARIEKAS